MPPATVPGPNGEDIDLIPIARQACHDFVAFTTRSRRLPPPCAGRAPGSRSKSGRAVSRRPGRASGARRPTGGDRASDEAKAELDPGGTGRYGQGEKIAHRTAVTAVGAQQHVGNRPRFGPGSDRDIAARAGQGRHAQSFGVDRPSLVLVDRSGPSGQIHPLTQRAGAFKSGHGQKSRSSFRAAASRVAQPRAPLAAPFPL
jgi:hypothetical protein